MIDGMKEHPILFSAPMVRSILAGTKTQTRRLVKPQPPEDCGPIFVEPYNPTVIDKHGDEQPGVEVFGAFNECGDWGTRCPYGAPGDRLWVRETWKYLCSCSTSPPGMFMHQIKYRVDHAVLDYGPMPLDGVGLPRQRERRDGETFKERDEYLARYWRRWRPSIHMPRWASRITLEVVGVRVEQLQDISVDDALAEGIEHLPLLQGYGLKDGSHFHAVDPRISYWSLWDAINGYGSVEANPWVWVVEFKRLHQDTNQLTTKEIETC